MVKAFLHRMLLRAAKAVGFEGFGGQGWDPWGNMFFGSRGYHGYPNTQINYAAEIGPLTGSTLVMVACNWIGTQLMEAPMLVVNESARGRETIPNHPLAQLLRRPNPRPVDGVYRRPNLSLEAMWKGFAISWIIDGNAYFLKGRNALDRVIELNYEPHITIRPMWPADGSVFISHYEVLRNGRWDRVPVRDVVHLRNGVDPYNPRYGLSPVASAHREIFTDEERARYSALILRNGGVLQYVISPKSENIQDIDEDQIKGAFEYAMSGDNLGRPIVLTGPFDVKGVGSSPDKLLVDKASQIPEERIAALIGIPASVLGFGVGLAQTKVGATMKEQREQAYENAIAPIQRLIAADFTMQLLPDFDENPNHLVRHDLKEVRVLQQDQNDLYERETLAYEKGLKTRAEARIAIGLEAKREDEVYFVEPGATQENVVDADLENDSADDEKPLERTKAKRERLVATVDEATDWLAEVLPPDARGIEKPETIQ